MCVCVCVCVCGLWYNVKVSYFGHQENKMHLKATGQRHLTQVIYYVHELKEYILRCHFFPN